MRPGADPRAADARDHDAAEADVPAELLDAARQELENPPDETDEG
jgi:hypothetical protein